MKNNPQKNKNMETGKIPLLGDPLPQMKVLTTHGPKTIPDDYKGKWLVLFSHQATSPVCTTEFMLLLKGMIIKV